MSTPSEPTNSRAVPRLPAPSNVWLHCRRGVPGCGADLANGVLDISEGGLQFLSKQPLAMGDQVDLVLGNTARHGAVRRHGDVRWIVALGEHACCVGVRFRQPLTTAELHALLDLPADPPPADALTLDH
jgi:hypothetical protein